MGACQGLQAEHVDRDPGLDLAGTHFKGAGSKNHDSRHQNRHTTVGGGGGGGCGGGGGGGVFYNIL